jgi:hypothetical protein
MTAHQTVTYTIIGTLQGGLWWPIGEPAQKAASFAFERLEEPRLFDHAAHTLRSAVEQLMREEDGDFSDAPRLTADSVLVVTRHGRTHRTERIFPLAGFASIADYIGADLWTFPEVWE